MNYIDPLSRVADLIGLLSILVNTFNGKADLYEVEREFKVDIDDLMAIVYTAESLGFVTLGEGDIIITDKGLEFLDANIKKRKEMLKEALARVEPFKTALELREFTLEELYRKIVDKGLIKYSGPSGMRDLEIILLEWGVYSGLLGYKEDKFYVR
ncbi:MAG: AAA-associated domain-containing protein [Sulfolobaceae archaeon]